VINRVLLCCLWAAGHAAAPTTHAQAATAPAAEAAAAPSAEVPPRPAEVLAVPPALRALLRERVIQPGPSREQRLQRLGAMLFDPHGLNLQYDVQATTTVAETWQQRRANCLSFTLLFVTLAREAGIQAQVQEVDQVVSWFQQNTAVYNVGHVNAGVTLNGRHVTAELDRTVLYGRRGPRPISDARALAHFYNNRGAERMDAGDALSARRYYDAALAQDERFVAAWNNRGVLALRQGQWQQAQRDFDHALQVSPSNTAALANASALLQRTGQYRQAARLQQRLQRLRREDPFVQYVLGVQAERDGDLIGAIGHYRRAVRLYDGAHPFHFALARAYLQSGRLRAAEGELRRAHALATAPMQARYQAKIERLQRMRHASAGTAR